MSRCLFGCLCICALGVTALVGCSETTGDGGGGGTAGDGGSAGDGGTGGTTGQEFPCTEQGIRDAVAEGGGPHFFACDGPTSVVTEAEIVIDNDVVLDGEGNLMLSANAEQQEEAHVFFHVESQASAELRGFTLSKGGACIRGLPGLCVVTGMIWNEGTLTLERSVFTDTSNSAFVNDGSVTMVDVTVSNLGGDALQNNGALLMLNSTVSDNRNSLYNDEGATLTAVNSTVSNNGTEFDHASLFTFHGTVTLAHSTVVGGVGGDFSTVHVVASLIVEGCRPDSAGVTWISNGYNIESPGDTCGFDQTGDQVNISADDLKLEPRGDNGGPTETHALLPDSIAIDQIPEAECVDADGEPVTTDQRGVARPQGDSCDVGAFELEVRP